MTLELLATEKDITIPEGEPGALARSLPDWPPFREVPQALEELRRRGWKLAILSNTDRELIPPTREADRRAVRPDGHRRGRRVVQAGPRALGAVLRGDERRARAPRPRRREPLPRRRARRELGLTIVWINRLGEPADPGPTASCPTSRAPDTLDELVPCRMTLRPPRDASRRDARADERASARGVRRGRRDRRRAADLVDVALVDVERDVRVLERDGRLDRLRRRRHDARRPAAVVVDVKVASGRRRSARSSPELVAWLEQRADEGPAAGLDARRRRADRRRVLRRTASRAALVPDGDRARRRRRRARWPDGIACARSPTATSAVSTRPSSRSGRTRRTARRDLRGVAHWMTSSGRPSIRRSGSSPSRGTSSPASRSAGRIRSIRTPATSAARRAPSVAAAGSRAGAAPALVRGVPPARLDARHARGRRVEPDRGDPAVRAGRDGVYRDTVFLERPSRVGSRREPPARPLPRLPHADGGRARRRSTSATRAAASSAPASCAFRAPGGRRRGDGRGGVPRAALPGGERDRGGLARGADAAARLRAARPAGRARAAAAARTSARSRRSPRGEECLAVVWIDAHGDLNTPETSPSGNAWGMPLRMVLDDGAVLGEARRARRRAQPRSARGRVHRGERASRPATTRSSARSRAPTRSTSRSTCDSRRAGRARASSCRSRTVCASTRSRGCCARSPPRPRVAGARPHRARARSGQRAEARAARDRLGSDAAAVTADPEARSKLPRWPKPRSTSRSSTSRLPSRRPKKHPEHVPGVRLALPGRRARREPAGLRAVRPPLPGRGARADRAARRRGQLRRGGRRPALGRPARASSTSAVQRAARGGRVATGLGDAIVIGSAAIEGLPCELAVMDFAFMGGSMGSRRRARSSRGRATARSSAACRSSPSPPRAARACRRGSSR